jgi:hypothetical protein
VREERESCAGEEEIRDAGRVRLRLGNGKKCVNKEKFRGQLHPK